MSLRFAVLLVLWFPSRASFLLRWRLFSWVQWEQSFFLPVVSMKVLRAGGESSLWLRPPSQKRCCWEKEGKWKPAGQIHLFATDLLWGSRDDILKFMTYSKPSVMMATTTITLSCNYYCCMKACCTLQGTKPMLDVIISFGVRGFRQFRSGGEEKGSFPMPQGR